MEVTPEQVIEPSSNYITTQSLTNTSTLRPAVNDHAFSRRKKNACVYIASLAAMLSPLSSNIYLSSTVTISKELKVPIHLIALTITIFMVVQGISPSFWGPLSDIKGRRLTLCCTLVVYLAANLALALTREYGTLLAFRGLQAGGGAATIAIGQLSLTYTRVLRAANNISPSFWDHQ